MSVAVRHAADQGRAERGPPALAGLSVLVLAGGLYGR